MWDTPLDRSEKRSVREKREREGGGGGGESEPATFVTFTFSVSLVDVCMESLEQKFFEMHKGSLNVETELTNSQ